jgi:hypothetical protein
VFVSQLLVRRVRDDDLGFLFELQMVATRQWHRLSALDIHAGNFPGRFWADLFAAYVVEIEGSPVGYSGAHALDPVHRNCWLECVLPPVPPAVAVDAGCAAIARTVDHVVEATGASGFYAYAADGSLSAAVFDAAGGWEPSGKLVAYDFAGGQHHDRLVYHRLVNR